MFHSLLAAGNIGSTASNTLDYTISNSQGNLNLYTELSKVTGFSTYRTFNVTVAAGVTIWSSSTSTPAFTTGTGWAAGTVMNIINNGTITGAGGDGGDFESGAGGAGGTAMYFTIDATLTNNNLIQGGGGGGGGGTNSVEVSIWEDDGGIGDPVGEEL